MLAEIRVGHRQGAWFPVRSWVTMDTLLTLARKLGLRLQVDVSPKTGVVAKVTKSRVA